MVEEKVRGHCHGKMPPLPNWIHKRRFTEVQEKRGSLEDHAHAVEVHECHGPVGETLNVVAFAHFA